MIILLDYRIMARLQDNRLDMIIFGATGYTGKYVVKDATHMCKEQKKKFGIAGRRREGLYAVVKEFASDIGKNDIPVIVADIKDEESLKKMAEQAKILINCCGPYRFYGEPVIKACIGTRTHYVDVTAEKEFMERMQLEYNHAAQKAGIYIVNACGVVCVPSDLGIIFTQQKFEGEINAVEVYVKVWPTDTEKSPCMNYTTWESLIYNLAYPNELQELYAKLYPTKLPELTPKLESRGMLHRSDVSEGWSVPYLTFADRPASLRTQRFLYDKYKKRPAQVQVYLTLKSFEFLKGAITGINLLCMSRTAWGRNLLLRYPALFSCSSVKKENESLKPGMLKSMNFNVTLKARGWTEKLAEPTDKHTDRPNKKVITQVSGDFPTYEATSIIAILSAITILNEADKMPDNGGVFTPGAAFGKTSLIEQMNKHNIKFEVISSTVK
ncbi:saccharopine dehydrogenase-like oxidoreductase isoform X1 [Temnothorax nylanderi]|uniref:saccharopine dehydrogenase-like oxidoreductase isoform X1 n=2 Tax=Temnothorax nylanderi TaxID=102681 RepID=UPI003A88F1D0